MNTYIVCWTDKKGNKIWDKVISSELKSFLLKNKLLDSNNTKLIENTFIFSDTNEVELSLIMKNLSSVYLNLNPKQELIYNVIKDYQSKYGYPPTVREICSLAN